MNMTLRACSVLLSYPSADLKTHVVEMRNVLHSEAALSKSLLKRLKPLLDAIESSDLLALQADYCALFDHTRALSLHLFEHVHGDSRERGQALIDLNQQYLAQGFLIEAAELPDYLPLFLEFVSCLSKQEAREWLGQPAHVLAVLEQRLAERGSPYAAVFQALISLADKPAAAEATQALRERTRYQEQQSVDEVWEEAPVNFAVPMPQPESPDIIARVKTAGEASSCAIKR